MLTISDSIICMPHNILKKSLFLKNMGPPGVEIHLLWIRSWSPTTLWSVNILGPYGWMEYNIFDIWITSHMPMNWLYRGWHITTNEKFFVFADITIQGLRERATFEWLERAVIMWALEMPRLHETSSLEFLCSTNMNYTQANRHTQTLTAGTNPCLTILGLASATFLFQYFIVCLYPYRPWS